MLLGAAPKALGLWEGMDAKSRSTFLELASSLVGILPLSEEKQRWVQTVLMGEGSLIAKVTVLAQDAEVLAAMSSLKKKSSIPPDAEICVSCPDCKGVKYIKIADIISQ